MRNHIENRVRRKNQRGSEPLEFTLVFLPTLGFLFLILNIAWAIYGRATLQYAVSQGVRYAVTSQTIGALGQKDSIRTIVQNNAFGQLGSGSQAAAWANIQIHFYLPDGTDVSNTVGGNGPQANGVYPLVEVSVVNITRKNLMPTVRMPGLGILSPIVMTADAWDRMESPPTSGTPAM
jgi:Flp pilus assembly protein TadG